MCWPPHVNINHHVKKNKGWKNLQNISSFDLPAHKGNTEKTKIRTYFLGWFLAFHCLINQYC